MSVKDQLRLVDRPWAVCVVGPQEVAVTLPYINQVQFISVESTMKLKRAIKVGCKCFAISHYNGELFISDIATVYVYTIAGALTRQFTWETSGDRLFADIRSTCVSSDGKVLYVADKNKGLIAVDTENGIVIFKYSDARVNEVCGICLDSYGNIFICGWSSHNVLQINEHGEYTGETVSSMDTLNYPQALCISRYSGRMCLFRWGDNGLMLDLKH